MGSLLPSTRNTRALPTGSLRYIRSDVPLALSRQEVQWLCDHRITTLVDLRTADEAAAQPCCLRDAPGFCYHRLPVTGGGGTPRSLEHLYAIYRQMVDAQMETILDVIMQADTNVLYFCTAGKDRTGVVSALLLRRLGFDDDAIIDDYMLSGDNLRDMLQAYVRDHPEVDINIILPHRENMAQLLRQL